MDVTSYLLGKNAGGGGGTTSKIYPYNISFRGNTDEIIDLSNVDFSKLGNSYLDDMFRDCNNVKELQFNNLTKAVQGAKNMFSNCNKLETANFDGINLGGVLSFSAISNMFTSCNSLTDESLNKILLMCTSATQMSGTKALRLLNVPIFLRNRIVNNPENFSNYQAFLDAGWTVE